MVNVGVCAVVRGFFGTGFERQEKVLLWRGDKSLDEPNLWGFPGGKLEDGETLEQCALRELKKETNLDGVISKYITSIAHRWNRLDSPLKEWVTVYFEVSVKDVSTLKNLEPHKHDEFRFVAPGEADLHSRVLFMGTAAVLKELKVLTW